MIRALTTGHGFGYTQDCAEFCKKTHTLTLGDVTDAWIPWRDDCVRAGPPGQAGTFYFSRAGWCPGDVVYPHEVDVDLRGGDAAAFQWQVEPYTNEVDGGDPYLLLSAYLISFE